MVGLRFALIRTWKEAFRRTDNRDLWLAVAVRGRSMVGKISDSLGKEFTIGSKKHRPVPHDVTYGTCASCVEDRR